ncbi:MAG: hypothetical protein ABJB86_17610 [Bacteroidota bacterium]
MPEEEVTIEKYARQVSKKVLNPHPYNRLMIWHRNHKQFRQELQVLEKAITIFSSQIDRHHSHSVAVQRLSKLIGKSTGLMDKSGKQLYTPGPLQKWLRRKKIVLAKMKRQTKGKNKKN